MLVIQAVGKSTSDLVALTPGEQIHALGRLPARLVVGVEVSETATGHGLSPAVAGAVDVVIDVIERAAVGAALFALDPTTVNPMTVNPMTVNPMTVNPMNVNP